jgi:hypothetical protein
MSEPTAPVKRRTFFQNWARWFVWITLFGTGFHVGQAVTLAAIGKALDGFVIFATGVVGYMIAGAAGGLLVALLLLLVPRVQFLPTTLWRGAVIAFAIGIVISVIGIPYTISTFSGPSSTANNSNSKCKESDIDAQFQAMKRLDDELNSSNAKARTYVQDAEKIWSTKIECPNGTANLSERAHAEYLDTMLIGNAESVIVLSDAGKYRDARKHLNVYFVIASTARPVAQAKGWKNWLGFERRATQLMTKYDKLLSHAGYP